MVVGEVEEVVEYLEKVLYIVGKLTPPNGIQS